MDKNKLFNIENYEFEIVNIPVTFRSNKKTDAIYHLLVDNDGRIHDYKIEFKSAEVECVTTKSHENKNVHRTNFRVEIFKRIGVNHSFGGTKHHVLLNNEQIKKWNEYFDEQWHNETFQNIIYIVVGCNASGEGIPESSNAKTNIEGKEYAIGFLLKALNISKETNSFDYADKWQTSPSIDFSVWIKKNQFIYESFQKFNSYTKRNEWKKDYETLKKKFSLYMKEKRELDEKIRNERMVYEKNCKQIYLSLYEFWSKNINLDKEFAHIYPVKQIRKNYLKTKNENDLKEISDKENCLPLSPDIHTRYDKYFFYWNTQGKLEKIKKEVTDGIEKFENIPNEQLTTKKIFYLDKYIKYLKDSKKI